MNILRIPMTGGVNLLADPRQIRDDELVRAGNLVPVRPGVLQTRQSIDSAIYIGGSFANSTPLLATFGPWVDSPIFFAYYTLWSSPSVPAQVVLLAYRTDGMAVPGFVEALMSFPTGDVSVRPWSFAFNGRLYFVTPVGSAAPAYSIARNETDLTAFAFAGTGNSGIRPQLAVPYRNRLVWANFGTGYENTVVFSDNFAPSTVGNDVLASNGRNVSLVAASDGDEIVGMTQVMLTGVGSPVDTALLVLRRYSAFLLTGEPDQTTGGTNSLVVNRMSVAAGCASPWTIQTTPYGTFWAGQDEVWCFKQGQIPHPVGTKIRPALEQSTRQQTIKWSAAYFDGFYRLSVCDDSSPQNFATGAQDQWFLDLRRGAPDNAEAAQWWGPQRYLYPSSATTTTAGYGIFARDDRPGGTRQLYGFEVAWSRQFSQLQASIVKYDAESAVDISAPTTSLTYGNDLTIKPDLITKEYDLGDPMLQKIYDGMEANVWVSHTGRMLAQGILDGGQQYTENTVDVSAVGFEPGVTIIDTPGQPMPRAPQAISASDVNRKLGTTIQLRLQGQAGYLIDDSNDQIAFEQGAMLETATLQVVDITNGFYETLADLLTEIGTKMGLASASHGSNGLVGMDGEAVIDNNYVAVLCFEDTENSVSQAIKDKTAAIFTLIGFSTGANITFDSLDPLTPWHLTGDMAVWNYNAPIWELNGLGMSLEVIPRRP